MLFQEYEWRILCTLLDRQLSYDLPKAFVESREPNAREILHKRLIKQAFSYSPESASYFYIAKVCGRFNFIEEEYAVDLSSHKQELIRRSVAIKEVDFWKYGMTRFSDIYKRDSKNYKEILFRQRLGKVNCELAEAAFLLLMSIRHYDKFIPHHYILQHPEVEGRAFLRGVEKGFAGRTEAFDFLDESKFLIEVAVDMAERLDGQSSFYKSQFLLSQLPGIVETIVFARLNICFPHYREERDFGDLKRLLEMSISEEGIFDYAVRRVLSFSYRRDYSWFYPAMRDIYDNYGFSQICSMSRVEKLVAT